MFREFAIAKQRRTDDHNRGATQAWLTAALSGRTKMPKLEEVLMNDEPETPPTEAQQRSAFHLFVANYGGTARRTRLVRVDKDGKKLPKGQSDGPSHNRQVP